ncbi:hypothetical protein ACLB2K_047507 [Fragaria x ananassa]
MYQRYQDAMALVQKYGRLDLFITMTCNPNWEEVISQLLQGQVPQDRPDLVTRVFHAKLEQLKEDVIKKGVLGKVAAHAFVVEFQKRGLPHVHMLIMLEPNDKLNNPDEYDRIVKAEIPDQNEEPRLYDAVCTHMIHGPCGPLNPRQSCMKKDTCNKGYPKSFANFTVQGEDAYPVYQRRPNRQPVYLRGRGNMTVNNRWVVPYNPWLLLRYNCHINVEVCGSIKSVKYLYKYIYKGPDRESLEVQSNPEFDEISQFVDARGPKSFLDLLTVNGALQPTFKQAAENRGLLENDNSIRMCLAEASAIRMPSALRRLFVTLLVYGVPVGVRALWDEFAHFMVEDYTSSDDIANRNKLLRDLNRILQQFGKNIRDYDLPQLTGELEDNIGMPRCIEDELFIHVPQEDIDAIDRLNNDQMVAFNTIMSAVDGKESALFFVDGPGGTGKTYLYRALLANLRRMNHIVLATASSGIAANILPGGRTAHSRFKIPLKVLPSSMCSIGKQSALAQLFDNQRLEKLKRNIENSSDNWSRGTAAIELSEFMFNQRWLTNGWLRWS